MKNPVSPPRPAGLIQALACAAALLTAAPALAQNAQPAPATVAAAAREADDAAALEGILEIVARDGFPGLETQLPALRRILDNAPAAYPRFERRETAMIVRTDDDEQAIVLLEIAGTMARKAGIKDGRAEAVNNVYPAAALYLGAFANEARRHEEALAVLDRGLALQPLHPLLRIERGAALHAMKRYADVVANYELALASDDPAVELSRGQLLRNKAVALIDLERLDEAEADLKRSLEYDPGNKIALNELTYIGQLRAGGARTEVEMSTAAQREAREAEEAARKSPPDGA